MVQTRSNTKLLTGGTSRDEIIKRFGLTGQEKTFVLEADADLVRRKYTSSSFRGDGTTLSKKIRVLGAGAYGEVALWESDRGKQFAVKTATGSGDEINALRTELKALTHLHETLPPYLKRFFVTPKPVTFFDMRDSNKCKRGCVLEHLGMEVIPGSVELGDFLEHWNTHRWGRSSASSGKYGAFKNEADWRAKMIKVFRNIKRALLGMWWHSGYLHADLHLGNIMIDPKTLRIKIIDFGLAKKIEKKRALRKLSKKAPWRDAQLLEELDHRWKTWFRGEWKKYGKKLLREGWRINLKKEAYGNPNSVYFAVLNDPGVKFYASDHLKLIRNIQRKIGRKST